MSSRVFGLGNTGHAQDSAGTERRSIESAHKELVAPSVRRSAHYFNAHFIMIRRAGLAVGGGTAAACAYGYYEARQRMGDDALARIISYDKVALPAIMEYKWTEAKCEKLPKVVPWLFPARLRRGGARAVRGAPQQVRAPLLFEKFMELGGFYYKNGQKIASNTPPGAVPKVYVDMFQPFLNAIPPRDPSEVRKVVEAELGRPRRRSFLCLMRRLLAARPLARRIARCSVNGRARRRQGAEPGGGAHLPRRRLCSQGIG